MLRPLSTPPKLLYYFTNKPLKYVKTHLCLVLNMNKCKTVLYASIPMENQPTMTPWGPEVSLSIGLNQDGEGGGWGGEGEGRGWQL